MKELQNKDTFTSLELTELINQYRREEGNKNKLLHKNLMAVIRDEFQEEINQLKIQPVEYTDKKGEKRPMFILNLQQSRQVLVRESKFVRKAVIKYIDELEEKFRNRFRVPNTFADALRLAAEQQELLEKQEPLVEYAEMVGESNFNITISMLGKFLSSKGFKTGPRHFHGWLKENGYIVPANTEYTKGWTPNQKLINKKLAKPVARVYGCGSSCVPFFSPEGQQYFLNLLQTMKKEKDSLENYKLMYNSRTGKRKKVV